jgi:hypothetical protein
MPDEEMAAIEGQISDESDEVRRAFFKEGEKQLEDFGR